MQKMHRAKRSGGSQGRRTVGARGMRIADHGAAILGRLVGIAAEKFALGLQPVFEVGATAAPLPGKPDLVGPPPHGLLELQMASRYRDIPSFHN